MDFDMVYFINFDNNNNNKITFERKTSGNGFTMINTKITDISTPIAQNDLDKMYAISSKRLRKNKELFKRAECFIEDYRYKVMDLLQDSQEIIDCYEA